MADWSRLFEPLRLHSGLELKNRLVMAPMPTFAAEADGSVSDAEIAYYGRRAAGGVAAVVTAGCAVADHAVAFDGQWRCGDDHCLPSLERTACAIREGGAEPVLQLSHAGIDSDDLRVEDQFGLAARRGVKAGFRAIEIHGGHKELLQRLLAAGRPEVCLRAVEQVAAAGVSVWYRADPEDRDRLEIETVSAFASQAGQALEVLDVSARSYREGSIRDPQDRRPRASLLAGQLPGLAVMAVGGINEPDAAVEAVEDGCSLVGLGHVLLADPDFARHAREGCWQPRNDRPTGDTLRAADVPEPVIQYLLKKSLAVQ